MRRALILILSILCFSQLSAQIRLLKVDPAKGKKNNIPDVFDMPPTVEFENSAVEEIETSSITLNFTAISQAVQNRNPAQNVIDRVHYAPLLKDATLSVNGVGAIPKDCAASALVLLFGHK